MRLLILLAIVSQALAATAAERPPYTVFVIADEPSLPSAQIGVVK